MNKPLDPDLAKELRIMHACEKGAVGVYRGHKCVARYFFRSKLKDLDQMRFHEREHSDIFSRMLSERGYRKCYFSGLWFWGGLFYGFSIGIFGLKAIGISTAVIEDIVEDEFEKSINKLRAHPQIISEVKKVQLEERQHRACGELFAEGNIDCTSLPARLARKGAYTAKYFAQIM